MKKVVPAALLMLYSLFVKAQDNKVSVNIDLVKNYTTSQTNNLKASRISSVKNKNLIIPARSVVALTGIIK